MDKNWTPIRRGKLYCSPRCGCRCTYAQFQQATKSAKALAKKLGPQWQINVWENCGWHWQVFCGVVEILPDKPSGFSCWIQTTPQFIDCGRTPEFAFKNALKKMQACFDALATHHSQVVHAMIGGAPPKLKGRSKTDG